MDNMKKLIISLIFVSLLAGLCYAYELYSINFPKDEVVVFENHTADGDTAKVISTYYKQGSDYVIKQTEENGNVIKTVVNKFFIPKVYKKTSKSGKILEYAGYNSKTGKLSVSIPSKRVEKTVSLPSGDYYDSFTLFYALRRFPFGKKDKIKINVAYHDPGNTRSARMYVKNCGKETVEIDAGKFECYKLEMGTDKAVDRAVWPYKYYFWFSADSRHHFVKFQGRERDASVITSELAIYKIGKKYIVRKASLDSRRSGF